MESGRRKARRILRWLDTLGASSRRRRALDFGCGVGRVAIPLADHFDMVVGVDIAPTMIQQARARAAAAGRENVAFLLNERHDLSMLADERFDLVFTSLVLQHLPSQRSIARYAHDLARLVAPGGALIAQVPDRMTLRARIQPRPKLYAVLRRHGIPPAVLYRRLHVEPIAMRTFPRASFERLLGGEGLRVASVTERWRGPVRFCTYQAVRPS